MLTDDDRAILDHESSPWRSVVAKEVQAHEQLGLTATRYYARLRWLEELPDAEREYPVLIHRLRRARALRSAARRGNVHVCT